MTTQAQGIGAVLEQTFARLQGAAALVLALGLLTAVVTDGSVPALATKALLAAMVLPTVVLAVGLTRPSGPSAPATCSGAYPNEATRIQQGSAAGVR